jgi:hypothetical protein
VIDQELVDAARESFSDDFASARQKFLGAAVSSFTYDAPLSGPGGERLGTDTAWIGSVDAQDVLVLVSGVHGAEGYAGSAIQTDLLRNRQKLTLRDNQAILLIHALNCHGFAWDRRVTEEGCDLNRNFIDFDTELPENRDYLQLAEHLLPRSLEPPAIARAEQALSQFRAERGERAFQIARKSGQYQDPHGTFFGGRGPTRARTTLETIAADHRLSNRRFVTIVDVHTGLGPYGYGEAQSEHQPESLSQALAQEIFGPSLTSVESGTSFSVPVTGTVQQYWDRLIGDGRYVYLCLEYGTVDQESSRCAYRADHWWHAHGDGDQFSPERQRIRQAMRAVFYPATPDWKEMVIARGRQIIRQALVGMSRSQRT